MSDKKDPQEKISNPWDVPRGQMVPTITGVCPHCQGTLGVPIQIQPIGVDQEGKVVALESEEQIQSLKGVLLVLTSPVQTLVCPRCSGHESIPTGGRIITL